MNFFYLQNNASSCVVYCHAKTNSELVYHLNLFIKNKKSKTNCLSLIYSSDEGMLNFENSFIKTHKSCLNFEDMFLRHNFNKDRLKDKQTNKEQFLMLYDSVALTVEDVINQISKLNKTPSASLEHGINSTKHNQFVDYNLPEITNFDLTISDFVNWMIANLPTFSTFNWKEFLSTYSILVQNCLTEKPSYETVIFENVYYKNKGFYNQDGSFFDISSINNDIEYKEYNKVQLPIDIENAVIANEPVLFLDYIYDFYNFGEFWDILKRLTFFNKKEDVEVYGLINNKVSNISQYFMNQGLGYPFKYCRDYTYKDVETNSNNGSTMFFKKLYLSTLSHTCRGGLDRWSAYEINKIHNKSLVVDREFKLYLTRGKEARGIVDEERLIFKMRQIGFIILDGSELLEEQKFYFTNASIIVGVHSSLMKNMIWCKKNPIFVELFPPTRSHMCFIGNAQQLGFKSIAIPCKANDKEEIVLSDQDVTSFVNLVKGLTQQTIDNVAVVFTACHDDEHTIHHFMEYYQSLGIIHFVCILSFFSYKAENEKEELEKFNLFCKQFKFKYPFVVTDQQILEYSESGRMQTWIKMLEQLPSTIDYIVPADSDELHEFVLDNSAITSQYKQPKCSSVQKNLANFLYYMEQRDIDYIRGCTMERVPLDGGVIEVNSNYNIFDQFSHQNNKLWLQPKISIIKKKHFSLLNLGHHYIDNQKIEEYKLKSEVLSITHHFRWSLEGKTRMQKWLDRWKNPNWKSWKNVEQVENRIKAFNNNLLTYTP